MAKKAMSPEAREKQMVNLAVNLAEEQMIKGTASSAVICHYLKLATEREKLNQQKLASETELAQNKASVLKDQKDAHRVAQEAIEAMKRYSGE